MPPPVTLEDTFCTCVKVDVRLKVRSIIAMASLLKLIVGAEDTDKYVKYMQHKYFLFEWDGLRSINLTLFIKSVDSNFFIQKISSWLLGPRTKRYAINSWILDTGNEIIYCSNTFVDTFLTRDARVG
jgi:hypothetical protein